MANFDDEDIFNLDKNSSYMMKMLSYIVPIERICRHIYNRNEDTSIKKLINAFKIIKNSILTPILNMLLIF